MATRLKAPFLAFLLFILLIASLTLNRYTFSEVVTDGSRGRSGGAGIGGHCDQGRSAQRTGNALARQ
jgi:hypothetical protein